MMKRALFASVAGLLVMTALPALAKGVTGAVIEGPGIEEPIVIEGDGTSESAGRVSRFLDATGFGQLVWGDPAGAAPGVTSAPPTLDLGAEFSLTWFLMGPEGDVEIPARLYPFADTGPLVHLEPGYLESFGTSAPGGWYAGSADLVTMLEEYGVQVATVKSDPAPAADNPPQAAPAPVAEKVEPDSVVPVVVLLAVLMAGALLGLRAMGRRPRRLKTS